MKIAYLGPPGTFSEEAAQLVAEEGDELIPFSNFPALISAVETAVADLAVLPIENSLEGSVSTTLDLLIHETHLQIQREVVVPVHHCLIGPPGAKITEIQHVHSHPQALGQCRRFLSRVLPDAHEHAALSTALAVEQVVQEGDTTHAAIGTARAAERSGGAILARNIEDFPNNATRFIALAERDHPPTGRDKTSLAITTPQNVPGSLYNVLDELAADGIQMTKLESRPDKTVLGQYYFLIDIEGHRLDEHISAVLERMRAKADNFQIWGSYPQFQPD
ncbi:MAG TPA: prephenate dehydratase [Thermomicrobiales bacterium]|nr:prephenate dehydratase [Thermomicrobiales bacterium]